MIERMTADEYRKGLTPEFAEKLRQPSKHRAKGTVVDGIRFDSAAESLVYLWLEPQLRSDEKLLIHLRVPLITDCPRISQPEKTGWISVDFTIWRIMVSNRRDDGPVSTWVLVRAVDAKPRRKAAHAPSWRRGARAFLATYGFEIEEVEL